MPKFRKIPVVIEAWLWPGYGFAKDAPGWVLDYRAVGGYHVRLRQDGALEIPTLEGTMRVDIGDWIIKGVEGELYPCKPGIFEKTYEAVD